MWEGERESQGERMRECERILSFIHLWAARKQTQTPDTALNHGQEVALASKHEEGLHLGVVDSEI